jgi:hypothetical protein
VWGRLDASCSWKEYAAGVSEVLGLVTDFQPQVVLGVDWHSVAAYDAMIKRVAKPWDFVYMNYR